MSNTDGVFVVTHHLMDFDHIKLFVTGVPYGVGADEVKKALEITQPSTMFTEFGHEPWEHHSVKPLRYAGDQAYYTWSVTWQGERVSWNDIASDSTKYST